MKGQSLLFALSSNFYNDIAIFRVTCPALEIADLSKPINCNLRRTLSAQCAKYIPGTYHTRLRTVIAELIKTMD
jgi:hypothetical protein